MQVGPATVTDTGRHLGLHQTQGKIQSTSLASFVSSKLVSFGFGLFGLVWFGVMS